MTDLADIAQLIMAVATLISALVGAVVAMRTRAVVQQVKEVAIATHEATNSKMDKLLHTVEVASTAKGRLQGKAEEKANPS